MTTVAAYRRHDKKQSGSRTGRLNTIWNKSHHQNHVTAFQGLYPLNTSKSTYEIWRVLRSANMRFSFSACDGAGWSHCFTLLTLWHTVLLETVIVPSASQEIPAFYGTRKFITAFARVRHWTLSWDTWIQPTPSQFFIKIDSECYLPPKPRSLPFRLYDKNFAYISHLSHATYPSHLILLDLATLIIVYQMKDTNYAAPH
jgi:hypothetical protein